MYLSIRNHDVILLQELYNQSFYNWSFLAFYKSSFYFVPLKRPESVILAFMSNCLCFGLFTKKYYELKIINAMRPLTVWHMLRQLSVLMLSACCALCEAVLSQ